MQKKIFRFVTITITAFVLIIAIVISEIGFNIYTKYSERELQAVAKIIVNANYTPEQISDYLNDALDTEVRVSFIESDGTVDYDNQADVADIENHSNRAEFIQAINNGSGEDSRLSKTLGETTYYYALQYQDGVIRFAMVHTSFYSLMLGILPVILCIAGGIIFVTTILSMKLAESTMKPVHQLVNKLDVLGKNEDIEIEIEYEELEPIVKSIQKLSKRLNKYINRLKREKEKVSLVLDNMVEGMILLDADKKIMSVNKSAVRLLCPDFELYEGATLAHLTSNKELFEIISQADYENAANGLADIHGRTMRAYVNKAHFDDTYGLICLLVDVTEAIKAETIRRDFSANVSHELKTPLTTIKGFGEMLENGIITDVGDVKKYGKIIFRESERLLLLINDIIRLSQIEEKSDEVLACCNLKTIAEDVCEILQNKADKQNCSLHLSGKEEVINGNQNYLNELILNLADNAIKYNNDGGNVWISIDDDGENAIIIVRDDGIGISQEDSQRIFERFYRVDKSRSKERGGTGLGLSIVKHIVSYHNGEIALESTLGKGTTIIIKIPLS